jgi:hypothetical protein
VTIFEKEGEVSAEIVGAVEDLEVTVLHSKNCELLLVGYLKCFHMVTCREASDKYWCLYCKLSKLEWKARTNSPGDEWSNLEVKAALDILEDIKNPGTCDGRGLKVELNLIFDAIDFDHFVLQVLHILLGLANNVYDNIVAECQAGYEYFADWCYYKLEKLLAVVEADV